MYYTDRRNYVPTSFRKRWHFPLASGFIGVGKFVIRVCFPRRKELLPGKINGIGGKSSLPPNGDNTYRYP